MKANAAEAAAIRDKEMVRRERKVAKGGAEDAGDGVESVGLRSKMSELLKYPDARALRRACGDGHD